MNEDAIRQWIPAPRRALGAWGVVIAIALVRVMLESPVAPDAPSASFVFRPPAAQTLDAPTVSRGSAAHDGVDRLSALTPPLKLAWSKNINVGVVGGGTAEPAVDPGGVFVGSDSGWVHAFGHDGSERWKFFDTNAAGGIAGAPALDRNVVYVATTAGNLFALDKLDGGVRWMHRFDGNVWSAPLLFEDAVYVMVSSGRGTSRLVRLRRSDGAREWQSDEIKANSLSGPAIDRVSGLAFVGAADRKLHAINLQTGHSAWSRELDGEVEATPTLIAGTLVVATRGEFVYALKLDSGDVIWKTLVTGGSKAAATWDPSTNVVVIGTNRGLLYALDRHTGKPRWTDRTGSLFSGMAGGVSVARQARNQLSRMIWITCADEVVCALEPKTGKITAEVRVLGPVATSPVVYDNALYLIESTGALRKFTSSN